MLPLIKVTDTARFVCSADPSVKLAEDDRTPIRWIPADEVEHDGDALVAVIRGLSDTERMRLLAKSQRARRDVPDGGEDELTPQQVADNLDANADAADVMAEIAEQCVQAFEPGNLGEPKAVIRSLRMSHAIALGSAILRESSVQDPTSAGE